MFHKKKKSRSLWPKLHSLILNFILCFCLATDTIFINTVYATSGLKSGINAAKDGQEGEPNDDPDVGESFKDAWAKKDCAWGSERDSLLKDNSAQTQKKQCKEACVKKYTDSKDLSSCSTKCDSAEYSAAYESCDSKKGDEYQKCITTNAGSWLQSEGINTGANGEIILSSEKQKKLRDIECAAEKIGWITQFLDLVTRDIDGSCPSAKLAQVGGLIGLADLGIMLFGDLKLRKLQYDYWKKYKDQNKMAKTKQLNDGEESTDDNSLSGSAAKSELKQKNEEAQKAALEYLKKELDELMKIDIAKMTSAALQTAIHAAATGVAAVETAMMFVPPNFGEGFTCKVPVETTNGLLAAADLAAVMGKGKNAKAFAGSASGKKRTAGSGSSKGGSGSGGTKDNSGSSGSGGTGGSKVGSSGTGGSKTVTGKQRFKEGVNKLINVKKLSKSDPEKVTPPKKTVTGKQRFKDAGNKVTKVKTEVSVINKLFGKKVDNPLDPKSKNTTTKGSTSGSSSVGPNKQAIKGGIRSKIGGLWDRLRGKKSGDSDVDVLGSKNKNATAAGSGTRVASLEPGFVTVKKKGDIDIEDGDVVGNRRAVTKDDIEASWEGLNTDKSRRAKLQKEYDDPSTSAARKKEIEQERANLKSEKYGQENVLMDNSKKQFKIDKANKKAKADLDEKFKDAPDDIKKQWDEVSSLMDPQKSKKMTAKEINEANQKMNKLAKDMRDQGLISEGDYNKFKKAYKTKRAKTRLEAFKDARANIGSLSKAMDTDELDKKRAELEEKKKKKQQEKDDLDNEEKNLAKQDQKIKDDLNDLDEKIRQKKNELSKTEDSINSKRQEFDNDQKELGTKKDKLKKDYDDGVADYDAKIADLRKKMDGDAKDLGDVTKQYEELGIQKNKEISDIKNLGKNKIVLEASNKQLNAIKRGLDGKNQKIRDLDAEASSLRNKSSELDSKTVDANQKFRDTETNINNRNKKISDDAEAEITNRNREIADLESQFKLDSGPETDSLIKNREKLNGSEMVDSRGNKKFDPDDYDDGKAFDQDTIKEMDNDAFNYVKYNKEIDAIGDDLGISGKNKSADDIEAALDKKNKKAEGDVNELNKDLDGIGNLNKKLDDLNNTKQPKAKAELADLESKRNAIGKDSDFDPKKAPPETITLKWDPAKDKFDVPSFDKITKADFDTLETKIKEKFGDSATSAKMGQLNKLRKNWENGQRKAFAVESSKLTTISTKKKGGKLTQSNPEFEAWKAKKREYDQANAQVKAKQKEIADFENEKAKLDADKAKLADNINTKLKDNNFDPSVPGGGKKNYSFDPDNPERLKLEIKDDVNNLKLKNDGLRASLRVFDSRRTAAKNDFEAKKNKAKKELDDKITKADGANKQNIEIQEKIKKLKKQKEDIAAKTKKDIEANNQKLADAQKTKNAEVEKLSKEKNEIDGNLNKVISEKSKLDAELRTRNSAADIDAQIARNNQEISKINGEIQTKNTAIGDIRSKQTQLAAEGRNAKSIKNTSDEIAKLEQQKLEFSKQKDSEIADVDNEINSKKTKFDNEIADLDGTRNKTNKELGDLEANRAKLAADQSNVNKLADLQKRKTEANSDAEIKKIDDEIAEIDNRIKSRGDQILTLNNKRDIRAREFEFQKNDIEIEVKKKNQEITDAESKIQKNFEQRAELENQKKDLKDKRAIAAAKGDIEQVKKLDQELTVVRTKQGEIELDYQQSRKAYKEATDEKVKLIKKQDDLDKDIISLRKGDDPRTVSDLQKRQAEIEEKLNRIDTSLNASNIKNRLGELESRINRNVYEFKGKNIDYEQKLAKLEDELGEKRARVLDPNNPRSRLSRSSSSKAGSYSSDFISKKKKLDDDFDENIAQTNKRAEQDFKKDLQDYNKIKEAELLLAEKKRINDALEMRKKEMSNAEEASNLYSKKMDLEDEIEKLGNQKNKVVDEFDSDMNKLLGDKDVIEAQGGNLSKINESIEARRQKLSDDLRDIDSDIKKKSVEVGDIDGRIRKLSPDRTRKFTKKATSKGGLTQGEIDVYNKLQADRKAMSGRSAETDAKIAELKNRKTEIDSEIEKTNKLLEDLKQWDQKRTDYKLNKGLQKEYDAALAKKKDLETQKSEIETGIDDIDKKLAELGAKRNASLSDIEARKAEIQKKLDFLNESGGKKRNVAGDTNNKFEGTINDKEFGGDVSKMKKDATDFENAKNDLRKLEDEFGAKNKGDFEDKIGSTKKDTDNFEADMKTDLDRLKELQRQELLLQQKNNADGVVDGYTKRDQELKDKLAKLDGDLTRKRNFNDTEFADPDYDSSSVKKMKDAQDKYFKAKEGSEKLENDFGVNKNLDSKGRSAEVNSKIDETVGSQKNNAKQVQGDLDDLDNLNNRIAAKQEYNTRKIEHDNEGKRLSDNSKKLDSEKQEIEDAIKDKKRRLSELDKKNQEVADLDDKINKFSDEAAIPLGKDGKPLDQKKLDEINKIDRRIWSDRLITKNFQGEAFFHNNSKQVVGLATIRTGRKNMINVEDLEDMHGLRKKEYNNAVTSDYSFYSKKMKSEIYKYYDALPDRMKKEFDSLLEPGNLNKDIRRVNEIFVIGKNRYMKGVRKVGVDPKVETQIKGLMEEKLKLEDDIKRITVDSTLGDFEQRLAAKKKEIEKNDNDITGHKENTPKDPDPKNSTDDLKGQKNNLASKIEDKLNNNKWGNDSFGSKADYKFDPDNPLATKNKISDDINGYDGVAKKTKDDYNNSFKDKEAARADFAKARQELKDNIKNKITQNNKDLDKFRNGSNVDGLDPTLDLDKINAQKKAIADRVKKRIDDNKVGVDGKKADLVFDENNIGKLEQDVKSNVNKRKADLDEKLSNYNNLENTKKRTQKDYNSARDKLKAEYQKRLSDLDDQTNKLDLDNTQADLLAQKQKLQDRLNNDVNPELSKIDLEEIKGRIARNNPDDPNFKADLDDDALSSNLGRKNNTDKDFFENLKKDNADLFKDDNFDMNRVTSNVEKPDFELTGKIKDLIDNKKAELDKLAKEKTDIDPEIDRLSNLKDKDTTDIDKKIAYFDKKLKDGDFWDGQKRLANIDDDYMYFKKGTGEDDGRIGRGLERFNKGKIWDVSPDDGVIKRTLKNVGNELVGLNFLNRAKRALKTNPEDGFIKRGFKLVGRELLFGMVNYKKLFKDKDQQRGVAGVREEQEVVQTEQAPLVDCNITPNDPSCGSKDICTTNPESKECICSRNPEDTVCLADTNDDQGQEEPEDPVVENKEPECSRCLLLDDEIERLKREIRTNRSLSREEKAAKGERIRSLVKKRNELWQQALEESRNNNNPDSVYKSNIQKADEMIAKLERLIKKKEELRDKFLKTFPGYRLYNKISQNISLMQSINTVERVNSMEDVIFADIEKRDLMSGKIKSPSIDHYQFMKEGKFFVKQNDNLGIVNKALSYSRALPEVAVDIVFPKSHAFIDKLISPFMDQWEAEQGREWEDSSDDRSFDDMMAEEKGKMVVTTAATIGTTMLLKMLVTKIPVAKGVRAGLSTSPGILFLEAMETTVAGLNLSHAAIEYQALKENADKLEGLMDRYDEIGGNKGSGDDSSGGSGTQTSTLYINQAATGALGAAGDVNRSGIKNVNCYSSKAGQAVMDATCGCKASNSCHQVDMSSVLNTPMANNRIDAQQVAALQKRMNEYLQGSSSVQNGNIESVSGNLKLATHFKRKADRMIRAMNKAAQKQGAKAPDTSLGKQLGFMDQILNKTMPPNWGNAWKGGGGNVAETRPPLDLPKEAKEINSNVQQVVASPSSSARSSASVKPGATKPKFDFELAGTADDKVNYMDKKWNISDNAALNKNQINNRKSTSIWTVISHRYRKTGVKVLFEESTQAK